MRRREFIAGLGGAAAWPLAARAQQGDRVRRIGVLMLDENDRGGRLRYTALTQALAGLGWIAELNERDGGAAPRPTERVAPAALVRATPTLQDDDTGIATISLRLDTQVLARIDTAAKRLGINRTVWLHLAAGDLLEAGDDPVLGKRDAGAARLGVAHR